MVDQVTFEVAKSDQRIQHTERNVKNHSKPAKVTEERQEVAHVPWSHEEVPVNLDCDPVITFFIPVTYGRLPAHDFPIRVALTRLSPYAIFCVQLVDLHAQVVQTVAMDVERQQLYVSFLWKHVLAEGLGIEGLGVVDNHERLAFHPVIDFGFWLFACCLCWIAALEMELGLLERVDFFCVD